MLQPSKAKFALLAWLLSALTQNLWASQLPEVERFEGEVSVLEPDFLRAHAGSSQGFTATSAKSLSVKRDHDRLWRMRFTQLPARAQPESGTAPGHAPRQRDLVLSIGNSFDRDVSLYFPPEFKRETYNLFDLKVPSLHSRFGRALLSSELGATLGIHRAGDNQNEQQ